MQIFSIFAGPLGWVLWFIYQGIPNYFAALFLFTLLVRALTFPLSLKSQKSQAERAKLAPRLERLQKKYAQDRQKLQQKQMELYEKEGVSMTGGCLPLIVQMIVLMGIIFVIYAPLTHLARIPDQVIDASVQAVTVQQKEENGKKVDIPAANKISTAEASSPYYREFNMLMVLDKNEADVKKAINALDKDVLAGKTADDYYSTMLEMRNKDFNLFGTSLLQKPWNSKGFGGISMLWLIPLFSWLTAFASSMISMRYTKLAAGSGEKQPGQGCSNVMMLLLMPLFSLFITFTVPGAVGIYWICSNLIAVVQTIILNTIYNPVKIRAQAEAEYEERRRKKAEDKKRLAEARQREEEEARRLAKEEAEAKEQARLDAQAASKKPKPATKNPNKLKRKEAAENGTVPEEKNEPADVVPTAKEESAETAPAEDAPQGDEESAADQTTQETKE